VSKTTSTIIGPDDVGRRMTLDDFLHAEGEGGRLHELSRGIVTVVDAPSPRHALIMDSISRMLGRYRDPHPGIIHGVVAGARLWVETIARPSDIHQIPVLPGLELSIAEVFEAA